MNIRKTLLAGAACLGTVAAAGTAFASDKAEEAGEAQFALSAPHSLLEAVRSVQADGGALVYEAAIEAQDGARIYELSALVAGKSAEFAVDPATGALTAQGAPDLLSRLFQDDAEDAGAAKAPLDLAIAAAEAAAGGKAMEAELVADDDDHARAPVWAIRVAAADGAVMQVAVDAATGAVLATGPASDED